MVRICFPMNALPLSPLQAGMFFESEAGACGEYLQQLVVCQRGEGFDDARVRTCWSGIAARVQALRGEVVAGANGAPGMEFREAMEPIIERQAADSLEGFLAADRARGLPRFPLWRVSLVQTVDEAALVWTFHHILLDGRSHARIFEAFWRGYDGGEDGL